MIELVTNTYVQFSFQDITFEIRDLDSNDGIFKKVSNVLNNVVSWYIQIDMSKNSTTLIYFRIKQASTYATYIQPGCLL